MHYKCFHLFVIHLYLFLEQSLFVVVRPFLWLILKSDQSVRSGWIPEFQARMTKAPPQLPAIERVCGGRSCNLESITPLQLVLGRPLLSYHIISIYFFLSFFQVFSPWGGGGGGGGTHKFATHPCPAPSKMNPKWRPCIWPVFHLHP